MLKGIEGAGIVFFRRENDSQHVVCVHAGRVQSKLLIDEILRLVQPALLKEVFGLLQGRRSRGRTADLMLTLGGRLSGLREPPSPDQKEHAGQSGSARGFQSLNPTATQHQRSPLPRFHYSS